MRKYKIYWVALLGVFFTVTLAHAGDERHIQGSTSMGGSQNVVAGRVNGSTNFSVMGSLKDILVIRLGPEGGRQVIENIRLVELKNLIFASQTKKTTITVKITGYQELGGGLVRISFSFANTPRVLNRGVIELYRGNSLLDSDQISIK